MNRRQFLAGSSFQLLNWKFAGLARAALLLGATAPHEWQLRVPLADGTYAWPRSPLTFPLPSTDLINRQTHTLLCAETGAALSFQRTNASFDHSQPDSILLFSDLPAHTTRTFRLVPRTRRPLPRPANDLVRIYNEPGSVVIDCTLCMCAFPPHKRSTALSPVP